jgi:hypothetical protein
MSKMIREELQSPAQRKISKATKTLHESTTQSGLSLSQAWAPRQLLQHSQRVPHVPSLDDLAVGDAMHPDASLH